MSSVTLDSSRTDITGNAQAHRNSLERRRIAAPPRTPPAPHAEVTPCRPPYRRVDTPAVTRPAERTRPEPAGGPGSGARTAAARSPACCWDAAGPRCSAGLRRSAPCSAAAEPSPPQFTHAQGRPSADATRRASDDFPHPRRAQQAQQRRRDARVRQPHRSVVEQALLHRRVRRGARRRGSPGRAPGPPSARRAPSRARPPGTAGTRVHGHARDRPATTPTAVRGPVVPAPARPPAAPARRAARGGHRDRPSDPTPGRRATRGPDGP